MSRSAGFAPPQPGFRPWPLRLVTILLACVATAAAAQAMDEYGLRAAMVYNLVRFVEWPAGLTTGPDLDLCVVSGNLGQIGAFTALVGKPVRNLVLRVHRRGPLAALDDCHAIYFDDLGADLLADKLTAVAGRPVLTLSSSPGSGAMIDLALADQRLVFDVHAPALRGAGLNLAARVLQLARTVHR